MRLITGSPRTLIIKWLGALCAAGLCAAVIFPVFATGSRCYMWQSSLSNLKQIGISVAIYQADSDEMLPPHFTFDGPVQTKQFIEVTMPYLKSEQAYLCPQDNAAVTSGQEGLPGKMSYVHCSGLKGKIPNFDQGNRVVRVTEAFPNIATTTYLRDPIRGATILGQLEFLSPHGQGFNLSYLDTHVKFKKPADINTEL